MMVSLLTHTCVTRPQWITGEIRTMKYVRKFILHEVFISSLKKRVGSFLLINILRVDPSALKVILREVFISPLKKRVGSGLIHLHWNMCMCAFVLLCMCATRLFTCTYGFIVPIGAGVRIISRYPSLLKSRPAKQKFIHFQSESYLVVMLYHRNTVWFNA